MVALGNLNGQAPQQIVNALATVARGEKVELPWERKVPLFAESETKLFPKAFDAEIVLLKDDKGAVSHLMLHQGATEIKAPRK